MTLGLGALLCFPSLVLMHVLVIRALVNVTYSLLHRFHQAMLKSENL
jgi:hypothetical protein